MRDLSPEPPQREVRNITIPVSVTITEVDGKVVGCAFNGNNDGYHKKYIAPMLRTMKLAMLLVREAEKLVLKCEELRNDRHSLETNEKECEAVANVITAIREGKMP